MRISDWSSDVCSSDLDQTFFHTVSAHGSPFIMVSGKPYLCHVREPPVFGDLIGRKVIVIINNWHSGCIIVIKEPGRFVLKYEIFRKKWFHWIRVLRGWY